jgi:eukaryotic-like serine/threonine-protein kinase
MTPTITLTIKNGRLAGTHYEFDLPQRCLIGRANDCQLRLPCALDFLGISRHHCLLTLNPAGVWVRDCGSRNGTKLNGMQIGRPASWNVPIEVASGPFRDYALHDGDELTIGGTVFGVSVSASETDPEVLHEEHELCACT